MASVLENEDKRPDLEARRCAEESHLRVKVLDRSPVVKIEVTEEGTNFRGVGLVAPKDLLTFLDNE